MLGFKRKDSLKFKLLFWVWLSTSIATTLFTGIQVYSEYLGDVNVAKQQLDIIERSYTSQIELSLWDFNTKYAQMQATSISKLHHVSYVSLRMGDDLLYEKGEFHNKQESGSRIYQLFQSDIFLGELKVQVNLEEIKEGYALKILKIFFLQSVKTFLVCWVLLLLFSRIVVRHIYQISDYLTHFNLDDPQKLVLNRNDNDDGDEFSLLVENINNLKERLYTADKKAKSLTENLEKLVEQRTAELEEARAKSFHASKLVALGEMASGVAHEINNPLAIIAGTVMSLEKSRKKGIMTDEYFFKSTEKVRETVDRISKVVSALNIVSRADSELHKEKVSLRRILESVVGLCRERFRKNDIELRIDLKDEKFGVLVHCNQALMSQVFMNLLNNSFDAVMENADKAKWIKIDIVTTDDFHEIRVTDSGHGVPEEIRDKIFNPFFTSKSFGNGSGLGLSMSLGILKELGGNLSLDDTISSCFIVKLPHAVKELKAAKVEV